MAGYSPAELKDCEAANNMANTALDYSTSSWSDQAQQAQKQYYESSAGMVGTEGHSNLARSAAGASILSSNKTPPHIAMAGQTITRIPVTREDLVEVSLKLQEAASLITQAISRLGAK